MFLTASQYLGDKPTSPLEMGWPVALLPAPSLVCLLSFLPAANPPIDNCPAKYTVAAKGKHVDVKVIHDHSHLLSTPPPLSQRTGLSEAAALDTATPSSVILTSASNAAGSESQ